MAKRYSRDVLLRCQEEYIQGKGTLKEIGERNGVAYLSLIDHSKRHGWTKLKEEYEENRMSQAVSVPGQIPDVPVIQPLDYQGQVQSFLNSAVVIEGQWKECVAEASNDSLTPSERVAFHRVSVQLSIRWQEVLRIPAVAAIKPEDKKPSNSETPAIPLEE